MASRHESGFRLELQVAHLPIGTIQRELPLLLPLLQERLPGQASLVPFCRSYEILNFGSKQLVQRDAEQIAGCVVRPEVLAGIACYQDRVRCVLEQGAKLPLALMQPLLGQLALGDVFVGDHRSWGVTALKWCYPRDEPAPLAGRVAGILQLEFFALPAENRADPLRKGSSLLGIQPSCRIACSEVVGAFGVVLRVYSICLGKVSPGLVDGDDGTRLVDNRYVRGEAVQGALAVLAAPGFFLPGGLFAS